MGSTLLWVLAIVMVNLQIEKTSVMAGKWMIHQTSRENIFIDSLRTFASRGDPCKLLPAHPDYDDKVSADAFCIRAMHGYNQLPAYAKTRCCSLRDGGCKAKLKMTAGGTVLRKWFCGFKDVKTGFLARFAASETHAVALNHCLENIELNPPNEWTANDPRW